MEVRLSDDDLILAMFDKDPAIALVAKRIYEARHPNEPQWIKETLHCMECFEGCPKCQPNVRFRRIK
jgi:hypothetical protein